MVFVYTSLRVGRQRTSFALRRFAVRIREFFGFATVTVPLRIEVGGVIARLPGLHCVSVSYTSERPQIFQKSLFGFPMNLSVEAQFS
jgi:hypothetical protein